MHSVSKMVSDRAMVARTVISTAEERTAEIADPMVSLLFAGSNARELSLGELIQLLGGALARAQVRLEELDVHLAHQLGLLASARGQRDQAFAELRAVMIATRASIEGAYGSAGLVRAGILEAVPANADLLVHYASAVAHGMEANELGESTEVTVDRAALAAKIRRVSGALRSALADVTREERNAQSARAKRDEQAVAWLRLYPGIADAIAGLAFAAGRSDIADRVRPTARRRQGIPEPTDVVDPSIESSEPNDPEPVDPEA